MPPAADRRADVWKQYGIISGHWLRDGQLDVYYFLHKQDRPFVEAARRWGKTTTILCYVLECLKNNPGWICRWVEPEKNQARTIIQPEMDKMQSPFDEEDKFKFSVTDSFYEHPNGSRLYLLGADDDKGKRARGTSTHILVADEFSFWRYPEILRDVFAPQLRTTKGQMIIASTPSPDLGHEYYTERELAVRENRFIQKLITDDPTATPEVMERIARDCGGLNSPTFRREYLCEAVANPDELVIPEFKEAVHVFEKYERPPFFDIYVGADLGFHDKTALLFGFYDFERATLVIEDELVLSGSNSKQITDGAKNIERRLYGERRPHLRVSDNDVQQLYDMATMCDYQLVPTQKDDKEAAVNALRLRFSEQKGRIRISANCKNLIYQLKVGMWNEAKKSFLRGDKTGHLDCIDALVYLNRNLNLTKNPYPKATYSVQNYFIDPEMQKPLDSEVQALESLLPFNKLSGT